MKKAQAALAAILLAPALALAFGTIDTLPWPSAGSFPAYEADPARPTDLWLHGGVLRDDNVLRLEEGGEADTVSRLGGGIRHVQRVVGRQRVRLEARADYYKFRQFDELDHLAYSALADWRWEIGNKLSGSLLFGRARRLVDLSETLLAVRSTVTTTRLAATGGYLVTPRMRLRAGLAGTRSERTVIEDADTRAASFTGGIDYVSPLGNAIGVEARTTDGEAPEDEDIFGVGAVSNDYREREVALVATYAVGPRVRAEGRFGRTTRRYPQLPARDFEGSTWRLGGEWQPGNKTRLELTFYREPRSIIDVGAAHVVIKGVTFGPSWAATNKLVFSARLLREDRTFEGDPELAVAPGTALRDETVHAVRFGVGWEPLRHWQVGLALDRGERESNIDGRDYDYSALSANLAWRY